MLGALLLAAGLAFTADDAGYAFECASNLVTRFTPRDAGTGAGISAAYWILDAGSIAGADMHRDQFKAKAVSDGRLVDKTFINLYCTFKGTNDNPWVIFVSHYDTKPGVNCPGANDGASTSGLLLAVASALANRGYDGGANIMLIWTDGEECVSGYGPNDGLWGSHRAVERLKAGNYDVRAVVCLDMLGDRNLNLSIPANGSESLAKIATIAAGRAGFKRDEVVKMSEFMKDDHAPFHDAGYAAIDIIDFDYGSSPRQNDWWHTKEDTLDKLSAESLLKSGRLVMELIRILSK